MPLDSDNYLSNLIHEFAKALGFSTYQGDIDLSQAQRLTMATDNSVYQVLPALVLFPKVSSDIEIILKLANQDQYRGLFFTLRGGGTSTNGQSLTEGVLIDCSRHLTQIKELNLEEEWVSVEPGVVLDQLNEYLKPHGYFFPVIISTSSRVTLGGMVNTNACGKGSTYYGRVQDQVLALHLVLSDGRVFVSQPEKNSVVAEYLTQKNIIGDIFRQVKQTVIEHQTEITELCPKLPRTITGYGLKGVSDKELFDLNSILVGAEGTLAAVTQIKLKITKLPAVKALVVVQYKDFQAALEDGVVLAKAKAEAIETMDGTILELAHSDILYTEVKEFIDHATETVSGLTLVEFIAENEVELQRQQAHLFSLLSENSNESRLQAIKVEDEFSISQLWKLRKKSVGLLGKSKCLRAPVSGMEDTLVPPLHLAEYIKEFRQILDEAGLTYGMFGHVDAGCLHVRPALDLTKADDQALYYFLSDKVAALVQKYNGIMWGEHGKGFRSQYMPDTFGPVLFNELCKIKAAFDPKNLFNPGKIAAPGGSDKLISIDSPSLRGDFNRQLSPSFIKTYSKIISCNGNGACFNVSEGEVMCPSYKVTHDRVHSPKGRSALIREWLRLRSVGDPNVIDFSEEVFAALHGCLGCKACAKECPVQVNIPEFKALFLANYYKDKRRSFAARVTAYSETIALHQSHFPSLYNMLLGNSLAKFICRKFFNLVDIPALSKPSYKTLAAKNKIKLHSFSEILKQDSTHAVVIVADWLNYCYDALLLVHAQHCLEALGYKVFVLFGVKSGETFKLQGYLDKYQKVAKQANTKLSALTNQGFAVVGLEPSVILPFQQQNPKVLLIQHWLQRQAHALNLKNTEKEVVLFSHCMESSDSLAHARAWYDFFQTLGLSIRLVQAGCCGMAGMYGHESEHLGYSKALYKMNWEKQAKSRAILLATGYSCRSQLKRMGNVPVMHPLDFLAGLIR